MRITPFIVAVLLAACTHHQPMAQRVVVERLVAPSVREDDVLTASGIGRILPIGADIGDFLALPTVQRGEPNPNNPDCAEASWAVGRNGQIALIAYNDVLGRISLHGDTGVLTSGGVQVGDTIGDVLAAYPDAERRAAEYVPAPGHELFAWTDRANYIGLRFEIGEDGRVTAIHAGSDLSNDEGCAGL